METILKIAPELRSRPKIDTLCDFFGSQEFFENLEDEYGREMCRDLYTKLKIKNYKAGEHVFNYNDMGDTFYIVLNGAVSIRIPRFKVVQMKPENVDKYITNNISDLITMKNLVPSSINEAKSDSAVICLTDNATGKREYKVRYLEEVKVNTRGHYFGELALIISKPRSATVTCKADSKLIYLNKHEYKKILGHAESKKLLEMTEFFKKFSFLSHLSVQALSKLIYSFLVRTYSNGSYIFRSDDKAEGIFLILEGDFQISQNLPKDGSKDKLNLASTGLGGSISSKTLNKSIGNHKKQNKVIDSSIVGVLIKLILDQRTHQDLPTIFRRVIRSP